MHGYAPAQKNLADMYAAGRGVKQDSEKAAEWYQEADVSSEFLEQTEVILLGFTPFESEDEWDAYNANKRLREIERSPHIIVHDAELGCESLLAAG